MRADREVVAAALRVSRGEALQYATASMRADPNLVESVLKYNGVALRHAAPELRADRALVRAAVEQSWAALKAAAPALRDLFLPRLNVPSRTFEGSRLGPPQPRSPCLLRLIRLALDGSTPLMAQ